MTTCGSGEEETQGRSGMEATREDNKVTTMEDMLIIKTPTTCIPRRLEETQVIIIMVIHTSMLNL